MDNTEPFVSTSDPRDLAAYDRWVTGSDPALNSVSYASYVVKCVAGTVMTVVTVLGQIMVFVVVYRDPRLRVPNNYFIVSLALADFLIGCISMPIWTVYSALDYWPFDQLWCDIWNVLDVVLCRVSIYTIFFISLDRYLTLKDPLGYPLKRTPLKTKVILASIWIFCVAIFSPFIELGQILYGKERNLKQCNVFYTRNVAMTFVMAALSLWTTLFSVAIIYILIYSIVLRSGNVNDNFKSKGDPRDKSSGLDRSSNTSRSKIYSISDNQDIGTKSKGRGKQDKAMKTITVLLVSLMVCWLPLSITIVLRAMHPESIGVTWMIVTYWMAQVNSMLNPMCYAIGNPNFRETLFGLFSGKKPGIVTTSSIHSLSSHSLKTA